MKIQLKIILNNWLPVFIWASIIFLFSSSPTGTASHFDPIDFVIKKTAHLVFFGIFSLLFYRGLIFSGVGSKKAGYWAILATFIYGITDEFHQSFTPGRDPTIRDVIIDTIGAGVTIYFIWNLLPRSSAKIKNAFRLILNS